MPSSYYSMWESLKNEIKELVVDGDMIHLSDLEKTMEAIEADYKE